MPDSSDADLTLWQRYRTPTLVFLAVLVLVVVMRVAFSDTDFGQGPAAYAMIGGIVVTYVVVRILLQRRYSDDEPEDADPRKPVVRSAGRSNVVQMTMVGLICLGAAAWTWFTGGSTGFVVVGGVIGIVAIAAAVVFHRLLVDRDEI